MFRSLWVSVNQPTIWACDTLANQLLKLDTSVQKCTKTSRLFGRPRLESDTPGDVVTLFCNGYSLQSSPLIGSPVN